MDRTDISNEYKRLAETIREKDLGELLSLRGIPTNKSAECPFCGGGKNTPCASYDKKRNRRLEKELQRKEKALAEAAAIMMLRKKVEAIWAGEEE